MLTVVDQVKDWAKALPYWEKAALWKLSGGLPFEEKDYEELVGYLLVENGLVPAGQPLPVLPLDDWHTSTDDDSGPILLVSMSELQDVNALVPDQRITFGERLTVLYGENASGKSGYARILGCAGFTRGDKEILTDINKAPGKAQTPVARIEIKDRTSIRSLQFTCGKPLPELSSFHVFDSTSVISHIARSHAFSFIPAALTLLHKLAEVTDGVRERLQVQIEARGQTRDFLRLFEGESDIAALMGTLSAETDLVRLASFKCDDQKAAKNKELLEKQKAKLLLGDPGQKIREITQAVEDIAALAKSLGEVERLLGNATVTAMQVAVGDCRRLTKLVQSEGVDQLATPGLTRVGSAEWQEFALKAKALAEAENEGRDPYPQQTDICLLCHQPLSGSAIQLIRKMWIYLKGDARTALSKTTASLDASLNEVTKLDTGFFGPQSVARRFLEGRDAELLNVVEAFLVSARQRKESLVRMLRERRSMELPTLAASPSSKLEQLVNKLQAESDLLKGSSIDEQVKAIDDQLRVLSHRTTLTRHWDEIKGYVDGLAWARKASKCAGNTGHITKKYNELFGVLVTKEYLKRFAETLKRLGCPMNVQPTTKGQKGTVQKQIALRVAHEGQLPPPDKVLSEGEKRAVALADFLTEVSLDQTSSGIVIDDPVTSLDHKWKSVISDCLVQESANQQVIIFTHDLHFLSMLCTDCEEKGIDVQIHWIQRGDGDGKPGYVFLDNCPSLESQFKTADMAKVWLRRAEETSQPEDKEQLLRQGFGALRTTYEAFVVFDIFKGVVQRWGERISIEGRLEQVVVDKAIVKRVIEKVGLLSRYIEGHLHTDDQDLRPTVEKLNQEILDFEGLRTEQKNLVKQASAA